MSGPQRRLARVKRQAAERFVVTCEHASNALPKELGRLGVPGGVLRSHVAWDPGAREVASIVAHRLGAAQFAGRYTRLLVDLNRNRGHRELIPKELFGVKVPGNAKLSRVEREARIAKYWTPYRETVEAGIARCIEEAGDCLHFGVHTFTPELDGEVRNAEIGLLYDPSRKRERDFAEALRAYLEEHHFTVRMNYPYAGTADGLVSWLRGHFPKSRYRGIELEINQKIVGNSRNIWRVGRILAEAIADTVAI